MIPSQSSQITGSGEKCTINDTKSSVAQPGPVMIAHISPSQYPRHRNELYSVKASIQAAYYWTQATSCLGGQICLFGWLINGNHIMISIHEYELWIPRHGHITSQWCGVWKTKIFEVITPKS